MKKIILFTFVFFLFISSNLYAQQLPMYSQYIWNDYIINPAYTGSSTISPVQLTYRKQWVGFNGSPETFTFGGHTSLGRSMGLGGMIFKDASGGAFSQTGGLLNYAYRIKLDENSNFSFGLSAVLNQYSFDANRIKALNNADVAFQGGNQNSFVPDASFGILYQFNNELKIGVAAHQLIQSNLKKLNIYELETNKLVRHYNLLASYTLTLSKRINFEPSILLKATDVTPIQMELCGKMEFNNFFWVGVSYRQKDAVVALLGIQYKNMFLGYSYDATLSAISPYSKGSSEIVLAYKFVKNKNKNQSTNMKKGNSKLPIWYLRKLKKQQF